MSAEQASAVRDQLDLASLGAYLREQLGAEGELELRQFAGGHSNLTYSVRVAGRDLVLKRAPPGVRAKSAHDMGREFRVLSALHGAYRYAPRVYVYCGDESILGSPFCVMERVAGTIVRSYAENARPETVRGQLSGLLDALCELHGLEPQSVGLGDFGRPIGYAARQVEGWSTRLAAAHTDNIADFAEVERWLRQRVPASHDSAAVIHNDFKLDNLVWHEAEPLRLKAVLDWEMSTIGHPLLDFACTLSFWVEHGDPEELRSLRNMPTLAVGAPTRQQAIEHYSRRTGLALDDIDFYLCFGLFRRAVIEQQKYARFVRGHSPDPRYARLDAAVRILRDLCQEYVSGRA